MWIIRESWLLKDWVQMAVTTLADVVWQIGGALAIRVTKRGLAEIIIYQRLMLRVLAACVY